MKKQDKKSFSMEAEDVSIESQKKLKRKKKDKNVDGPIGPWDCSFV